MSTENRFCSSCGAPFPANAAFCTKCGASVSLGPASIPISGIDAVIKESSVQTYWIKRVVAFVIDAVMVYVVLGIIAVLLAIPYLLVSGPGVFSAILAGAFSIVAGVILLLYFTVAETSYGCSIGKRVMALKVVDTRGKAPSIDKAFIRNISKIYWLLLLLDVIVGLATSKEYTQKYSDRFMGTSVVKVEANREKA